MSMLQQGSGKTIYSPPGTPTGIINQSRTSLDLPSSFDRPQERFAQITPIERKGLTELTPTNPIDITPKFAKQELTNIPAESPGLFGIKNLFKKKPDYLGMIYMKIAEPLVFAVGKIRRHLND